MTDSTTSLASPKKECVICIQQLAIYYILNTKIGNNFG